MNAYPRLSFKRDSYISLNGIWDLNGHNINVPYPKESILSNYPIKEYEKTLVYTKSFKLEKSSSLKTILHFQAVDNITKVYLNDNYLGEHIGGYLPFSFDISSFLKENNILKVIVEDNTNTFYPYGKQSRKPSGMWYTAISGIWKDVWIEQVPIKDEIRNIRIDVNLDNIHLFIDSDSSYKITIPFDCETYIKTFNQKEIDIDIKNIKYQQWDPDNPKLYPLYIETANDKIESYLAIREFKIKERNGVKLFYLNNRPIYLNGVLDQGYFIDGIYLPKSNDEYYKDILRMKELGFNMLRKHIKVEDDIFYYYCDKLGMLVMQDMVNSGDVNFVKNILLPTIGFIHQKDDKNIDQKRLSFFIEHSKGIINHLYNHPCIVSWTIYNESWGQQCASKVYKELKKVDNHRPFDTCSGWYKTSSSDIDSYHVYFRNKVLHNKNKGQVLFLSEYGGIKRHIENHEYSNGNYGYGNSNNEKELTDKLENIYLKMLIPSINNGLCGSVLTQLSDVEEEVNGLYTYDREVCKIDKARIKKLNKMLYEHFIDNL